MGSALQLKNNSHNFHTLVNNSYQVSNGLSILEVNETTPPYDRGASFALVGVCSEKGHFYENNLRPPTELAGVIKVKEVTNNLATVSAITMQSLNYDTVVKLVTNMPVEETGTKRFLVIGLNEEDLKENFETLNGIVSRYVPSFLS